MLFRWRVTLSRRRSAAGGHGARVRDPGRTSREQDLLSAFDNAPVGMAVLTPSGVITACNAAMGRLLDRAPADLVGGTFFDVTHVDDLEEARRKCALMQVEGARIVAPRVPVRAAR